MLPVFLFDHNCCLGEQGRDRANGGQLRPQPAEHLRPRQGENDRNRKRGGRVPVQQDLHLQDIAIELKEVGSGFRIQVRGTVALWVQRLWEERPTRYSRALLETLALIAYRQPITRGEIEDIRGVTVSTTIMRTLHERNWIRVVGHREVPGRPSLFATTRTFLDDLNLRSLSELPPLEHFSQHEIPLDL